MIVDDKGSGISSPNLSVDAGLRLCVMKGTFAMLADLGAAVGRAVDEQRSRHDGGL